MGRSSTDTAKGVYPLEGQYISTLKSGACANDVKRIERLATTDGANVASRYQDRFGNEDGFAVHGMSDTGLAAVRADPDVAHVVQNVYYTHLDDGQIQVSTP